MQKSMLATVLRGTLAGLTLAVFTAQPVLAQQTTYYFIPHTMYGGQGAPYVNKSDVFNGPNAWAFSHGHFWLGGNSAGAWAFAFANCKPGLGGPNTASAQWNGGQMGKVAKSPPGPATRGFTLRYFETKIHYATTQVPVGQTAASTAGTNPNNRPYDYVSMSLPPPNNQTPNPSGFGTPVPFPVINGGVGNSGLSTHQSYGIGSHVMKYAGNPDAGGWTGNATEAFTGIAITIYTVDKLDEAAFTSGGAGYITPAASVKATANNSGNMASSLGLDVMIRRYMLE